jgi:rRNA maturation RNase YbeY
LQHDFFTDIITFDLSEAPNYIVGEIYISIDRVKENALLMKTNREEELLRVIFHGALHLCGFKDKKQSDIKIMREKEDQYLKLYKKFLFQ